MVTKSELNKIENILSFWLLHVSLDVLGISILETNLSQNVVYQNEEGRWVTDLAYYTSFNNEQDSNMSLNEMNEDFRSGCKYVGNYLLYHPHCFC